ncbi:magnesium chelatase [Streptomyces sp. NPDC054837]
MTAEMNGRVAGPRQRLLQVLACSALGPGLDGVLLFDLEPEMVAPVTDAFARVLGLRSGRPVRRAMLGSVTGDDELWLRPTLRHEGAGMNFSLAPGPLVDIDPEASTLVVVPDLVRLSLPGMRAAVQLLGADVAAVERSGFRARWRPRARWLAACRESEVGRLSPHLLDRFPIRLNAAGLEPDRLLDVLDRPRQNRGPGGSTTPRVDPRQAPDALSGSGVQATSDGPERAGVPPRLTPAPAPSPGQDPSDASPLGSGTPEPHEPGPPDAPHSPPGHGEPHALDTRKPTPSPGDPFSHLAPDDPGPLDSSQRGLVLGELPEVWRGVLAAGRQVGCAMDEEAAARVVALFDGERGGRRALGLARLARALAVFGGDDRCGAERVDEAARLIGVAARPPVPPGSGLPADRGPVTHDGDAERRPVPEPAKPDPVGEDGPADRIPGASVAVPAGPAEALDTFAADTGDGVGSPFPEDDARFLREFAPLRIPWQRRPEPSSARGPVIGVRSATTLRDLAFVATAIEAAKHQNLPGRRALRTDGDGRLVVLPGDFRSYARLPVAERMLVLLLDHTCRRGWDWQPALAPYLQWAYTGRASICVVEVGNRDAAHELKADHFVARSVLDPRVGRALHRPAGRSSPLAHGLAMTDQLLRRAFQQRSNLVEAWLVVVSDGRGNVPLDTGTGDRLPGPVRRTGIEDALSAAGRIGAMGRMRLHSVVVDAARQPYPDLTFQLADALGGVTVAGRTARGVTGVR